MQAHVTLNSGSRFYSNKICGRSLVAVLALGVILSGGMPRAAAQSIFSRDKFVFEQFEVITGTAKSQAVLTGFLLGGEIAELAVVNIDESGSRLLSIYAFGDSKWELTIQTTLRREVMFIDVANIAGRDRLVTYERGHLNWFDPTSES